MQHIQREPEQYYDRKRKTVHHCKKCDEAIPVSRKEIGLCFKCDLTPPKIFKKKQGFFR